MKNLERILFVVGIVLFVAFCIWEIDLLLWIALGAVGLGACLSLFNTFNNGTKTEKILSIVAFVAIIAYLVYKFVIVK